MNCIKAKFSDIDIESEQRWLCYSDVSQADRKPSTRIKYKRINDSGRLKKWIAQLSVLRCISSWKQLYSDQIQKLFDFLALSDNWTVRCLELLDFKFWMKTSKISEIYLLNLCFFWKCLIPGRTAFIQSSNVQQCGQRSPKIAAVESIHSCGWPKLAAPQI